LQVKKLAALFLLLAFSLLGLAAGQAPSYVLPGIKRDALLNGLQLIALEQQETGSVTARQIGRAHV
jgi:hypothetical protein